MRYALATTLLAIVAGAQSASAEPKSGREVTFRGAGDARFVQWERGQWDRGQRDRDWDRRDRRYDDRFSPRYDYDTRYGTRDYRDSRDLGLRGYVPPAPAPEYSYGEPRRPSSPAYPPPRPYRHNTGYRGHVPSYQDTETITIAFGSDKERYAEYQVPGQIVDVRLRQNSNSPCVQGATFGYRGSTLWADQGCRGYFTVTFVRSPYAGSY